MPRNQNESALIVLSGGQDSTTCLGVAARTYERVEAITFDYGQRHRLEIEAARTVARMLIGKEPEVITLPPSILASTSPLVSDEPLEQYENFKQMDAVIGERVELTFVPMRNALFLTIAANRAIALGMRTVVTGVCQMDNANYPDCRMEFIKMMEGAINAALGISDFYISTPLISRAKDDTVRLAHSMPKTWEAMAYTHTCYAGTFPPCGKCHACVLRAEGFARAGLFDPLIKRALA